MLRGQLLLSHLLCDRLCLVRIAICAGIRAYVSQDVLTVGTLHCTSNITHCHAVSSSRTYLPSTHLSVHLSAFTSSNIKRKSEEQHFQFEFLQSLNIYECLCSDRTLTRSSYFGRFVKFVTKKQKRKLKICYEGARDDDVIIIHYIIPSRRVEFSLVVS